MKIRIERTIELDGDDLLAAGLLSGLPRQAKKSEIRADLESAIDEAIDTYREALAAERARLFDR